MLVTVYRCFETANWSWKAGSIGCPDTQISGRMQASTYRLSEHRLSNSPFNFWRAHRIARSLTWDTDVRWVAKCECFVINSRTPNNWCICNLYLCIVSHSHRGSLLIGTSIMCIWASFCATNRLSTGSLSSLVSNGRACHNNKLKWMLQNSLIHQIGWNR